MKIVRIIKRILLTLFCLLIRIFVFTCIFIELNPMKKTKRNDNIIVSITSFGVRLKKCTWLAIYSMFLQTQKPERIVLYLDYSFQTKKLPFLIRKLQKIGLEITYTKDIRSYTKLVPALKQFPNKTIITVDDDIFYSKTLIENLVIASRNNANAVCANIVRAIDLDEKENPKPYSMWISTPPQDCKLPLFALGYGGVLYPPLSMNIEYMKEENFMNTAPSADDIWFFAARYKENIPLIHANTYSITLYPVNYLYERFHKNSGLTEENVFAGKNDAQLLATLKHFNLRLNKDV